MCGPLTHQYPTLLKMISPMICSFNFVFNDMSKRSFTYCAWHYRKNLLVPSDHTARGAHHHLLVAMW